MLEFSVLSLAGSSETTVYGFLPHLSPTSCDDVDTPTEHAQPVGFEILPQAPQQARFLAL